MDRARTAAVGVAGEGGAKVKSAHPLPAAMMHANAMPLRRQHRCNTELVFTHARMYSREATLLWHRAQQQGALGDGCCCGAAVISLFYLR